MGKSEKSTGECLLATGGDWVGIGVDSVWGLLYTEGASSGLGEIPDRRRRPASPKGLIRRNSGADS